MTALLQEMKTAEATENRENTREQWQLIFDIWSNVVATAEEGRERMESLGLTYEQIEAGCGLLDQRKGWVEELAASESLIEASDKAAAELNKLDAEFAALKAAHEAKRGPLIQVKTAGETAAFQTPVMKNNLLKNPLPLVAERKRAIDSQLLGAAARLVEARNSFATAENRERFLQAAVDRATKAVEDHVNANAAKYRGELKSAVNVLERHQQGPLAQARGDVQRLQSELQQIDDRMTALLSGDALKVFV